MSRIHHTRKVQAVHFLRLKQEKEEPDLDSFGLLVLHYEGI